MARRAGVAPATAYTYFTSKAHLVAEVFWRRLRALPDPELDAAAPAARPGGGRAARRRRPRWPPSRRSAPPATPALLGADPEVHALRDRIGAELHRRVAAALAAGDGRRRIHADDVHDARAAAHADDVQTDAVLAEALDLMLAGALLRAGTGHLRYDDLGDRLAALSRLVIGDRP